MQSGKSVQFQTINHVVDAYNMRNVPAFSIYQGKQLLIKYEGEDLDEGSQLLNNFLTMLQDSAAIYTLCVYEEFTGKINDKTPYHGSWNFRFSAAPAGYQQGSVALQGIQREMQEMREMISRKQIEQELDEQEEQAADPVTDMMDKINGIISHPVVERFIPVLLNALNMGSSMLQPALPQQAQYPAAMAGVNETETDLPAEVIHAVHLMIDADPSAAGHLITLGELAQSNPKKFKTVLSYMKML